MKSFLLSLLIGLFAIQADGDQDFFERADTFFSKYVSNNLVDYRSIDRSELSALADEIAKYPLEGANKDETLAFYLNAYNILTIKNVLDNGIPDSPLDVKGFFDTVQHNVGGKSMTLNNLENDIIRPKYGDARIHFALVCGAVGCPPLTKDAFRPSTLSKQLDKLTRSALNSASFLRVDQEAKTLQLSEIFKWYLVDFGGSLESAHGFINKYRHNPIPDQYTKSYYSYDWKLNIQ